MVYKENKWKSTQESSYSPVIEHTSTTYVLVIPFEMVSGTEHLWQSSKSVVVVKFMHQDADKNAIRRCPSVISLQLKLAIQVGNWPQLTANLNGVRLAITRNQFVIIRWINCRKQTFTLNRKHSNDLHSSSARTLEQKPQLSAISPSRSALVWRQDALHRSTCAITNVNKSDCPEVGGAARSASEQGAVCCNYLVHFPSCFYSALIRKYLGCTTRTW